MKGKLFQYAILFHPNTQASEILEGLQSGDVERKPSEMLVQPKWIVAQSEDEVKILAARDIPAEYTSKVDQLELLVRPFVR